MPRAKKRPFAAEREILEAWIPSDSSRPVYSAVRSAFIEKFARFYVLITAGAGVGLHGAGKVETSMSAAVETSAIRIPASASRELDRLDRECIKLAGLLFDRSNLWAARDWHKPAILRFLMRRIRRPRGGRPLSKLRVALQVKEVRTLDPESWTWPKLTAKFCDCGKEHTFKCKDNLRREVLHLEKFLRECGLPSDLGKSP